MYARYLTLCCTAPSRRHSGPERWGLVISMFDVVVWCWIVLSFVGNWRWLGFVKSVCWIFTYRFDVSRAACDLTFFVGWRGGAGKAAYDLE